MINYKNVITSFEITSNSKLRTKKEKKKIYRKTKKPKQKYKNLVLQ